MKLSRAVREVLAEGRPCLSPVSREGSESEPARLVALGSPDSVRAFTTGGIRARCFGLSEQQRSARRR
jgi:hypothetical protein